MKNLLKNLILQTITICFVIACNDKEKLQNANGTLGHGEKAENFQEFKEKFIADSSFRMSRIDFPIPGYNSETDDTLSDNVERTFLFNATDFCFYSEEDFRRNNTDKLTYETSRTDTTNVLRIYKKDSGYDMNYHFKLDKGKWKLVYYSYSNF